MSDFTALRSVRFFFLVFFPSFNSWHNVGKLIFQSTHKETNTQLNNCIKCIYLCRHALPRWSPCRERWDRGERGATELPARPSLFTNKSLQASGTPEKLLKKKSLESTATPCKRTKKSSKSCNVWKHPEPGTFKTGRMKHVAGRREPQVRDCFLNLGETEVGKKKNHWNQSIATEAQRKGERICERPGTKAPTLLLRYLSGA